MVAPVLLGPVSRCVARRDLTRMRRYPGVAVQMLFLPVFFVVVWSSEFGAATQLSGFPSRSLVDWLLPLGILAGCVPAAMIPGFAVARDIESGFLDRLLLAPVRPIALVLGWLVAGVCRALVPLIVLIATGLLLGARIEGGAAGFLLLLVAAFGTSLCATGWSLALAFRLGRVRPTTHLMNGGSSFVLYLSTGLAPLSIMAPWLRSIARVNPMTEVFALARQAFVGPVTWRQTWPGLLAVAVGVGLFGTFAVRAVRHLNR